MLRVPVHRSSLRCLLVAALICPATLFSQVQPNVDARDQMEAFRTELANTRAELADAREEIRELSARLKALEEGGKPQPSQRPPAQNRDSYRSPADLANENQEEAGTQARPPLELTPAELATRVEEQQQTKVESASKYRVKVSGLILMNAFSTRGAVDQIDLPNLAFFRNTDVKGSFGASVRQSILGLQVFGPTVGGARTSADLAVDFFGGFPREPFGTTSGIVRLRTAAAHFDWQGTSINIGQQGLFISPISPTSYATVAQPALSWAGNLWTWTPQLEVEHRFSTSDTSFLALSGGILAPLTADPPESSTRTQPGPGERSRRPAFASQFSFHSKWLDREVLLGVGGYTGHLVYNFGRETDSWAFTSFWQVPLTHWLELSGEGYRGRGVSGLGGGLWQNVAYNGDPLLSTTQARFLNSLGGWGQLKFKVHPKWELNGAIGQDNVLANDLEWAAPILRTEYAVPMARNRISFGNVIYHPKSNVLFSAEYRRIWTYRYTGTLNTADQVNLAAGVSF